MSIQKKLYGLPDTPPRDTAAWQCDGCGRTLASGENVRQESLFYDVLGCDACSEWRQVRGMDTAPLRCPNCGEELDGYSLVLLGGHGGTGAYVPLACDVCCTDAVAAVCCREAERMAVPAAPPVVPRQAAFAKAEPCAPVQSTSQKTAGKPPWVAVANGGANGKKKNRAG